jgi:hypothetical protein
VGSRRERPPAPAQARAAPGRRRQLRLGRRKRILRRRHTGVASSGKRFEGVGRINIVFSCAQFNTQGMNALYYLGTYCNILLKYNNKKDNKYNKVGIRWTILAEHNCGGLRQQYQFSLISSAPQECQKRNQPCSVQRTRGRRAPINVAAGFQPYAS